MESGRRTSVRTKFGVMFMLMGLLTGLFATFAPLVEAAPVGPGTVGGFEIDGDQAERRLVARSTGSTWRASPRSSTATP